MKRYIFKKVPVAFSFSIGCLLVVLVGLNTGCQKIPPDRQLFLTSEISDSAQLISSDSGYNNYSIHLTDTVPLDQLIVWKKPKTGDVEYTSADVAKWIRRNIGKHGHVDTVGYCENCDSSLLLIAGIGVKNYLQGGTATGGKGSIGVQSSGGNGPCWVSMNFPTSGIPIKITDGIKENKYTVGVKTSTKVRVAVIDEGDNLKLRNHYPFSTDSLPPSCIWGADKGWNFIAHNNDTHDDGIHGKHGADVTSYITERVEKYLLNDVEILTAKAFNGNEEGELFDILCAIAYAANRKVKIINCSFGFYMARDPLLTPQLDLDPDVMLFKEFIRHYTNNPDRPKDERILLVAAAGNKDDANEHAAFNLRKLPYPANDRNLKNVYFFPASLAEISSLWNVIPITSVDSSGSKVDPSQNYSPDIVYGVQAKHSEFYDGLHHLVFNNPRLTGFQTNVGSSFATGVASGVLCATYDANEKYILQTASPTTNRILKNINNAVPYKTVDTRTVLSSKIKDGIVIRMKP